MRPIVLILLISFYGLRFANAASVAEFIDHQYSYAFQYPSDWKMKPPLAKQKDELGEMRVLIQGPRAALSVIIGHVGKSVSESQFLNSPESERVVKMMIDLSVDRYKRMSKTFNATRMNVLETKVVPSTEGIRFYISTIHFIEGQPPLALIGTHLHPFDKTFGIIFFMTIVADQTMKESQNLYDSIFNSFHLVQERPGTEQMHQGSK